MGPRNVESHTCAQTLLWPAPAPLEIMSRAPREERGQELSSTPEVLSGKWNLAAAGTDGVRSGTRFFSARRTLSRERLLLREQPVCDQSEP